MGLHLGEFARLSCSNEMLQCLSERWLEIILVIVVAVLGWGYADVVAGPSRLGVVQRGLKVGD